MIIIFYIALPNYIYLRWSIWWIHEHLPVCRCCSKYCSTNIIAVITFLFWSCSHNFYYNYMISLNPRTELIHRERLASNVVSHLFLFRNVGPTCWRGWVVAAILDLCTTATSKLKNNAGNEFLVVNLVRQVVLYIFLAQNVKKLYFLYCSWWPFWKKTWITQIAQGWHLHTLRNLQTGGLGSSILQRKKNYILPSPGIPPWLPD